MFGYGSNDIGIGLAISLHDNFTQTANHISNSFERLSYGASRHATGVITTLNQMSHGMYNAGKRATEWLGGSVSVFASYEYMMTSVKAITGATSTEMEKLNRRATDLALNTIFTSKQVSGAFEELARAGLRPGEIDEVVTHVAYLAAATGTNIRRSAELATDMMTAMGLEAKDMARAVDLMTITSNNANLTFTQLGESMKYVGYNMRLAKVSMEETYAMIGALANAGLKGSRAGTTLNNFLVKLAQAMSKFRTSRQESVLQSIGLTSGDVIDQRTGQLKNMMAVLSTLARKVRSGEFQGVGELQALFGLRGGRAALVWEALKSPSLGKNVQELYTLMMTDPAGYAKSIADAKIWGTTQGQILALKSAWEEFRKEVGKTFVPIILPIIKGLRVMVGWIRAIVENPIGKVFIIAAGALSIMMLIAGKLAMTFMSIGIGISLMTGNFKIFASVMKSVIPLANRLLAIITAGKIQMGMTGAGRNWYRDKDRGRFTGPRDFGWFGSFGGSSKYPKTKFARMFLGMGSFGKMIAKGLGIFKGTTSGMGRLMPIVGRLGGLLGRFAGLLGGPLGWIVTIGSIVGWGRVFQGVAYGLKTLGNGLLWILDSIGWMFGLDTSPLESFRKRQYQARQDAGWEDRAVTYEARQRAREESQFTSRDRTLSNMEKFYARKRAESSGKFSTQEQIQAEADRMIAERYAEKMRKSKVANLNLYVDGQKKYEQELYQGLEQNITVDQ